MSGDPAAAILRSLQEREKLIFAASMK